MTLKRFLQLMSIATLLCWAAGVSIIVQYNPEVTPWWGFVLFYGSLFGATLGTVACIGVIVRLLTVRRIIPRYHILISVRQDLWCAIAICASLLLLRAKLWTWWIEVLLLIALLSCEGFFLAQSLPKSYSKRKSAA
jgi:hypothetical protein